MCIEEHKNNGFHWWNEITQMSMEILNIILFINNNDLVHAL